jgi:hypothetical protein
MILILIFKLSDRVVDSIQSVVRRELVATGEVLDYYTATTTLGG